VAELAEGARHYWTQECVRTEFAERPGFIPEFSKPGLSDLCLRPHLRTVGDIQRCMRLVTAGARALMCSIVAFMRSVRKIPNPDGSVRQMRAAAELRGRALIDGLLSLRSDGLLGQGTRFAISGVVVSIVYIAITTVLSTISHLRFQIALAIGWSVAVIVHFTLQRTFVWVRAEGFALPFRHQVGRYLLVAVSQLAVSATTTAVLPSVLGVSAEVVYLATAAVITVCNFVVFRTGVFHADSQAPTSS
jgi:putative flippase GtrA